MLLTLEKVALEDTSIVTDKLAETLRLPILVVTNITTSVFIDLDSGPMLEAIAEISFIDVARVGP